jgi:hypothetical protein
MPAGGLNKAALRRVHHEPVGLQEVYTYNGKRNGGQ